jgi:hypothetical protein
VNDLIGTVLGWNQISQLTLKCRKFEVFAYKYIRLVFLFSFIGCNSGQGFNAAGKSAKSKGQATTSQQTSDVVKQPGSGEPGLLFHPLSQLQVAVKALLAL